MNLNELCLKNKPSTKYFDHGWISFSTTDKELYYAICIWSADKTHLSIYAQGSILSKEQLDGFLSAKTFDKVREFVI